MTRQICFNILGSRDQRSNVTAVVTHCIVKIWVFSYIVRHIMPLYSNLSIRVKYIKLLFSESWGSKGQRLRGHAVKIWDFWLLLTSYGIWMVPVQSLWGLKEFHSQRIKRNVSLSTSNLAKVCSLWSKMYMITWCFGVMRC